MIVKSIFYLKVKIHIIIGQNEMHGSGGHFTCNILRLLSNRLEEWFELIQNWFQCLIRGKLWFQCKHEHTQN